MVKNKGIVITSLCTNPSCTYSEKKYVVKQPLTIISSSGKATFKILPTCKKCQSPLELPYFISGSIEIEKDNLEG